MPESSALVVSIQAQRQLRDIVGADFRMAKAINADKIKACQKLLDHARENFFEESADDLVILERIAGTIGGEYELIQGHAEQVEITAFNIKGQAELYGFGFIAQVCGRLIALVTSEKLAAHQKGQAYSQLINALRIAYEHRITDNGADVGAHLLEGWGLET